MICRVTECLKDIHNHPFIWNKQIFETVRSSRKHISFYVFWLLGPSGTVLNSGHTHSLKCSAVRQWAVLVRECHLYSHHQIHPGGCPHHALLIYQCLAHGDDANWFYYGLLYPLNIAPTFVCRYTSASQWHNGTMLVQIIGRRENIPSLIQAIGTWTIINNPLLPQTTHVKSTSRIPAGTH